MITVSIQNIIKRIDKNKFDKEPENMIPTLLNKITKLDPHFLVYCCQIKFYSIMLIRSRFLGKNSGTLLLVTKVQLGQIEKL